MYRFPIHHCFVQPLAFHPPLSAVDHQFQELAFPESCLEVFAKDSAVEFRAHDMALENSKNLGRKRAGFLCRYLGEQCLQGTVAGGDGEVG